MEEVGLLPEDTDADSTSKVQLDSIISSSNAHRESSGSMIRIQCAAAGAAGAPQVRGTGQGDDTTQRGRDLVRGPSPAGPISPPLGHLGCPPLPSAEMDKPHLTEHRHTLKQHR